MNWLEFVKKKMKICKNSFFFLATCKNSLKNRQILFYISILMKYIDVSYLDWLLR